MNAHGVCGSCSFKSHAKENDLLIRISNGQLNSVEGRIHDANVATAAFDLEQIAVGTGHAQHVAEGAEDDAGLRGNRESLIDQAERSYADGTTGPVNHLDAGGQHLVDAVANDGVCLAAADFHDLPRPRGNLVNFARHALGNFAVAEFGEVLHYLPRLSVGASAGWICSAGSQLPSGHGDCGALAARANASSSLASSSSRVPIFRNNSRVSRAVCSSILDSANPTWTMV